MSQKRTNDGNVRGGRAHYETGAQRRMRERRARRRRRRILRALVVIVLILIVALAVTGGVLLVRRIIGTRGKPQEEIPVESVTEPETEEETEPPTEEETEPEPEPVVHEAHETDATRRLGEEIVSEYAVFIDLGTDEILGVKDAYARINPASMTKVLTVLVAAEHLADGASLDDPFTITLEETDYCYQNDCSAAGFDADETVTVRDLFYGTILPSGADAAAGLAIYTAGSLDAFVDLMNEKLEELGLADTAHVTNCVGLYNEDHYCTMYDMAMILEAALDNEWCREVLSTHVYTTTATEAHPDGIVLSNWFLRRIEDRVNGYEVVAGKTGYVVQSGNCAASFGVSADGSAYICVTGNSSSAWQCIYDHVALYDLFAAAGEEEGSEASGGAETDPETEQENWE